jgi:hypothetical protein
LFKVQQGLGKGTDSFSIEFDKTVDQVAKELHLDDLDYYDKNRPPQPDPATRVPGLHSDEFYQATTRLIEHLKKENSALSFALGQAQDQAQYSGQRSEPAPDA